MSTTEFEGRTVTVGEVIQRGKHSYRVIKIEGGHVYAEKLNPKTMQPYKSPLRKWSV